MTYWITERIIFSMVIFVVCAFYGHGKLLLDLAVLDDPIFCSVQLYRGAVHGGGWLCFLFFLLSSHFTLFFFHTCIFILFSFLRYFYFLNTISIYDHRVRGHFLPTFA